MHYQQWKRAKHLASKVFNAPREGLEAAWKRIILCRTVQDHSSRYSLDYSWATLVQGRTQQGWGQLIAQRC